MLSDLLNRFGLEASEDILAVALPLLGKLRDSHIELNEREDAAKVVAPHSQVWINILPAGVCAEGFNDEYHPLFIVDLEDENEVITETLETDFIFDVERAITCHQLKMATRTNL